MILEAQNAAGEAQRAGRKLGETLVEAGVVSKATLAAGLSRQRRFIAAAMAAISLFASAGTSGEAMAATTRMQVTARILTHLSMRSMIVPDQLGITAADVARGYVDLDAPIQMELRTNTASGVLLGISLNSPAFTGAVVSGPSGTTHITPGAPTLVVASLGQGMRTETLSMHVRIELAANAEPGTVMMPISLFLSAA
jgi:hypothetical protein